MKYKQITSFILILGTILLIGRFSQHQVQADISISSSPQSFSDESKTNSVVVISEPVAQTSLALVNLGCSASSSATDSLLFGTSVDLWQLGSCQSISVGQPAPSQTIVAVDQARPSASIAFGPTSNFEKSAAFSANEDSLPEGVVPIQTSLALMITALGFAINRRRVKSTLISTLKYINSLTQPKLMVFQC